MLALSVAHGLTRGLHFGPRLVIALLFAWLHIAVTATVSAQDVSQLWGAAGEAWSPESRLPDFSFAGYRSGEQPIPNLPVRINVKAEGAKGDGVTDDSGAFIRALAKVSNGAILVPEGRYVISTYLQINKSNVVLRGMGPDNTTLFFKKPIRDTQGPCAGQAGAGGWFGGLICVGTRYGVSDVGAKITRVTAAALRGDTVLTVASSSAIRPGRLVALVMYESADRSLGRHLHADQMWAGTNLGPGTRMVDFVSSVKSVRGNKITLERPLRVDVRPEWMPAIHAFAPKVQGVGLEDFTIEFPSSQYPGHHKELGYNGISMLEGVANSWVRDVTILDTDNGHDFNGRFITAEGLRFATKWRRATYTSHHFVILGGQDILIRDFSMESRAIHDITVIGLANGNVVTGGKGVDINFDHHRLAPYENLFSDIDTGRGSRVFASSGVSGPEQGPNSGARETFWNIRRDTGASAISNSPGWPQINVIGASASKLSDEYAWLEQIDPMRVSPDDLYLGQLSRRLTLP